MKGLSLTQPWASLIAIGAKQVETRSRRTWHRSVLAIHAAKGFDDDARLACWGAEIHGALDPAALVDYRSYADLLMTDPKRFASLPRGAVVAVATVINCVPTEVLVHALSDRERAFGNYERGRWAWVLKDVRPLAQPVPCRGALGLWDVPPEVESAIDAQLVAVPA